MINLLPMVSPITAIIGVPLVFVLYCLFTFVLLPLQKMRFYKRPDAKHYFGIIGGLGSKRRKDVLDKGDILYCLKNFKRDFPNHKFEVSNFISKAVVMLCDPDYSKEFVQKPQFYKKDHFVQVLKPLIGNGLFLAEGETWKRHRKVISGSFNYELLKSNVSIIQDITAKYFKNLPVEAYKDYSVISRAQDITGEIVGRIFFGKNLNNYAFEGGPLTIGLAKLIKELVMCAFTMPVLLLGPNVIRSPFLPKFKRLMNRINRIRSICLTLIEEKKNEGKSDDLLGSLLATQQLADPEQRLSDTDIVDEFITFFVAGMDTTGQLIGMTLYNLSQNPQYLEDLKTERDQTYNTETRKTIDSIQKMDVLHSILKETLRLYTPVPGLTTREAIVDHNLLDLKIRKGDLVRVELLASCFDEKNFEEPRSFKPERWRGQDKKLDPYAFIPFSAGPRNCIGQHLAIIESKVIVSEFLERFNFKAKDDYQFRMTQRLLYEPVDKFTFDLVPK